MDMEFDKTIHNIMENYVLNTSTTKEYVAYIECNIRTVKEITSCFVITMPFKYLHKFLITNIVYFEVLWLNELPFRNGISDKLLPYAVIVRINLDEKQCKLIVRTYYEVNYDLHPSNITTPRKHEEIAMGPTGNLNVTQKFFFLKTGRILKRRQWDEHPMPQWVINKVNKWG